jgi:UDP-N-acetyl-D-galactosamine dehydrogenase
LEQFGLKVFVHDPIADAKEANREYGLSLTKWQELPLNVGAVVAAVAHRYYLEMPIEKLVALLKPRGVFTDVKSAYDPSRIREAGHMVWRL